jgi:hypothetical protein
VSVPAHEKPSDGKAQPATVGSAVQVPGAKVVVAQQYVSLPAESFCGTLQM